MIDTHISLHGEYCYDSVLVVEAVPEGQASVGGDVAIPRLTAAPNPFVGATRLEFTLPRAGTVSLAVFDIAGRRLRSIVAGGRLESGTYERVWDGRLESGAVAARGLYAVRLDTPTGQLTRMVAKVR